MFENKMLIIGFISILIGFKNQVTLKNENKTKYKSYDYQSNISNLDDDIKYKDFEIANASESSTILDNFYNDDDNTYSINEIPTLKKRILESCAKIDSDAIRFASPATFDVKNSKLSQHQKNYCL